MFVLNVAPPTGLEPVTPRLEGECSILLSYGGGMSKEEAEDYGESPHRIDEACPSKKKKEKLPGVHGATSFTLTQLTAS